MELKEALNKRKSVRSYTGELIDEKQLNAILTAAYEAPVGMGKYDSIHLTLITNKDLLNQIDQNAAEFFGNPQRHPLYGAPLLIVVSTNGEGNVASANVGIIIQNMALAAVDKGVGQCDIYGAIAALNQNPELLKKTAAAGRLCAIWSDCFRQEHRRISDKRSAAGASFRCGHN